jgi:hypothetical protein
MLVKETLVSGVEKFVYIETHVGHTHSRFDPVVIMSGLSTNVFTAGI